jgi:hypothetical protein
LNIHHIIGIHQWERARINEGHKNLCRLWNMMDTASPTTSANGLASLADEIFNGLAHQFPVCMASDEFHYFPQYRAEAFRWRHWDDFSPPAMDRMTGQLALWERRLGPYAGDRPNTPQTVDAAMLLRVVRTLREQFALARVHEIQPTFYLTIVGIGLAEAIETGPAALGARLRLLPAFLDQAGQNLKQMPRLFRDLGIAMLAEQQQWLRSLSVPPAEVDPIDGAFRRLAQRLRQVPIDGNSSVTVEAFEQIAADHIGCRLTPDAIALELNVELEETRSILRQSAETLSPGSNWQTVISAMPQPPNPPGGLRAVYADVISELARHCSAHEIVSAQMLQECPVTVEAIPDYMRPVRSNAAYSMPPGHPPRGGTFYILESGARAPVTADYRLLAAHETFPGHHLLDTCRWRHQRPIRRHIEFPIFYEGWASFAEELLFETGFFNGPADRMLMAKRRFWRAMRGQVDFDIHMGRRTRDQAVAFLIAEGMAPRRATAMVRRYCLKPGYQLAYTMGRRRFRHLYDTFTPDGTKPVAFAGTVLAQGEIGFLSLEHMLRQGG